MFNIQAIFQAKEADRAILTEENKWDIIRLYRNDLLTKSDWSQLQDAPLTEEQRVLWETYRQQLRDLPTLFATADEVVFPEEPVIS